MLSTLVLLNRTFCFLQTLHRMHLYSEDVSSKPAVFLLPFPHAQAGAADGVVSGQNVSIKSPN